MYWFQVYTFGIIFKQQNVYNADMTRYLPGSVAPMPRCHKRMQTNMDGR